MKRKSYILTTIVMLICAVFFACAGFAVSDYFKREDTVTARADAIDTSKIYWNIEGTTLNISHSVLTGGTKSDSFDNDIYHEATWNSTRSIVTNAERAAITKVNIIGKLYITYTNKWFDGFTNLTDITSLANIDVSTITAEGSGFMYMFRNCTSLTDIEAIRGWDVSNIDTYNGMFYNCTGLTQQAFEPFFSWFDKFKKLRYIDGLFYGCTGLTEVDLSGVTLLPDNSPNGYYIDSLFYGCTNLKKVNVSNLVKSHINGVADLFHDCNNLTEIIGLDTWDISNVTRFGGMFRNCTSLRYFDLSSWSVNADAKHFVYFTQNTDKLEVIKLSKSVIDQMKLASAKTDMLPFPLYDKADKSGSQFNNIASLIDGGTYFTSVEHKHDYLSGSGTVTPPTCKDDGYTIYNCYMCGEIYKTDIVAADPGKHVWGNWITLTAADCVHDEVQKRTCTVCSTEETQTLTGTATGHAKGTHHDAVAATCSKTGNVEYWECNNCGKFIDDSLTELSTVTIPINPNAHSFTNYVSNNNATCTDNATETADCENGCGQTDTREIQGTAKGHKWATAWSKDATNHWHVCENGCGVKGGETAHVYNWVTDTPATTTTTGIKHEECVCGAKRNANTVIPIQTCAHTNLTHYPRVEATCVAAGNIEYWHCADCNKNLDSVNTELPDITIPIDNTAHVYTNYVSDNNATCNADGTKTAQCDHGCGETDTVTDVGTQLSHSFTNYVPDNNATCTADGTKTAHCDHGCGATDTVTDTGSMTQHSYEWVITKPATKDEAGLMQNKCTVCGDVAEEKEIAKLEDPNGGGEIDLPVDINVEFKVTQSSTDNDYSELEGLKRGYWAQLWYRNEDGTLGDEFTDKMNCFLTLKIPTEIIEAIRGGEEINRDKIAEGLAVYYYVDGQRYAVDNFAIAQRDDESWQIKFNYNAKFRAEVVFNAPNAEEKSEPAAGIPWWVWLIVGLAGAAVVGVVIVIIVVAKKKSAAAVVADNGEVLGRLDKQDEKLNEIREIVDGGFNDIVDDE